MMRPITLALLLALAWPAAAEGLVAQVDRTRLGLDETLELTLETDSATLFGPPDLAPLETLFLVGPPRQINRLASVQGQTRSLTRWQVTLQPRQAGQLLLPALQLGQWRSEPIALEVLEVSDGDADLGQLAPIFIDASLDRDSVYVQAQVTLTLRIYHSVSLYDDSTLSPLQMADAHVERLGEPRTYEKVLNGIRHGVIEIRYALYPQRSGELTIPSQVFSATSVATVDGSPPYGARPGRSTQVKTPSIPFEVRPKPADYPADVPWIPATDLSLVEAWNPAPEQARVGESLTRSLMLRAEGLSAAQLPLLPETRAPGLRSYPDQPRLANEVTDAGLVGSREQSEALVPSRAGNVQLADIEIVWWNTVDERLERTTLPGRQLEVVENPALFEEPVPTVPVQPTVMQGPLLWPWQLSTLGLACTTLLGFVLWLRARRQPAVLRVASGPSPRSLLDDLRRACQANDPQATRQALDAWARQQPETLADMAARYVPLSDALDGLNGALYSESGQHWQGEALWQAINALPSARTAGQPQGSLPPLYPR